MKKYWMIPLIIAVLFMGCSSNQESTPAEDAEGLDKSAVFATFLEQEDLDSYEVKVKGETIYQAGTDKESSLISQETIAFTKEPKAYHVTWKDQYEDQETPELEMYLVDDVAYYEEADGSWSTVEEAKKEYKKEGAYLDIKPLIGADQILKPLEDYYELTEEGDTYVATLDAKVEDLEEIQATIEAEADHPILTGELALLKAQFTFKKDTGYPVSFSWEIRLVEENTQEVTEARQEGHYDKVNQLEEIQLPEEIQELQ